MCSKEVCLTYLNLYTFFDKREMLRNNSNSWLGLILGFRNKWFLRTAEWFAQREAFLQAAERTQLYLFLSLFGKQWKLAFVSATREFVCRLVCRRKYELPGRTHYTFKYNIPYVIEHNIRQERKVVKRLPRVGGDVKSYIFAYESYDMSHIIWVKSYDS